MSTKIAAILIVGVLFIGSFGAVVSKSSPMVYKRDTISISNVDITDKGRFIDFHIQGETSSLMETGKPVLPVITKIYTFPLGTEVSDISVRYTTKSYILDKKIQPAPRALPLLPDLPDSLLQPVKPDETVYNSDKLYPSDPYEVELKAGLYKGEHTLYVVVHCYTQYSPAEDTVYVPENIDISISYKPVSKPLFSNDEYDLLIITDEKFKDDLQRLVDYKNSIGVKTVLETVQEIYPKYNGRDKPEDIKLAIKDAIEQWGIKYVLLAGGHKGQTFDWYIPSRRTHNDDGWEGGYESDLYYADVYKVDDEGKVVFEDWDSNHNGVFAEWSNFVGRKDIIDYLPDVSIGRIPFRYVSEVKPMVDKIITYYESMDDSWFKKGIVISGDTFPPSRGAPKGWYEGEIETGKTVDNLESIGFTVKKLWLSIPGVWEGPDDVVNAFNDGAGFVHFAGHSNPASWGNFPPNAETESEFVVGLKLKYMKDFTNREKLPVVILGGCHSAQFNVTMSNIIKDILEYGIMGYFFKKPYRFYYMEWVPRDLSSALVLSDGGAIVSIGNSGLGYGYVNQNCTDGLGGWIEPHFFELYVKQGIKVVGDLHTQAITDYVNGLPPAYSGVNKDQIDRKTVEEWTFLGDPSLHLGTD